MKSKKGEAIKKILKLGATEFFFGVKVDLSSGSYEIMMDNRTVSYVALMKLFNSIITNLGYHVGTDGIIDLELEEMSVDERFAQQSKQEAKDNEEESDVPPWLQED